jgi:hypothetical protein
MRPTSKIHSILRTVASDASIVKWVVVGSLLALATGCVISPQEPNPPIRSSNHAEVRAVGAQGQALEIAATPSDVPTAIVDAPQESDRVKTAGEESESAGYLAPGSTREGDPPPYPLTPGPRPGDDPRTPAGSKKAAVSE